MIHKISHDNMYLLVSVYCTLQIASGTFPAILCRGPGTPSSKYLAQLSLLFTSRIFGLLLTLPYFSCIFCHDDDFCAVHPPAPHNPSHFKLMSQ